MKGVVQCLAPKNNNIQRPKNHLGEGGHPLIEAGPPTSPGSRTRRLTTKYGKKETRQCKNKQKILKTQNRRKQCHLYTNKSAQCDENTALVLTTKKQQIKCYMSFPYGQNFKRSLEDLCSVSCRYAIRNRIHHD